MKKYFLLLALVILLFCAMFFGFSRKTDMGITKVTGYVIDPSVSVSDCIEIDMVACDGDRLFQMDSCGGVFRYVEDCSDKSLFCKDGKCV